MIVFNDYANTKLSTSFSRCLQVISLLAILVISSACAFNTSSDTQPTPQPLTQYYDQVHPLLAEQRYTEAVEILEQATQTHSDSPDPLLKIGQIYLTQQRWLLAEDAFNRALARDLDNAQAAAGLAKALFGQGRLPEAEKWWQKAIQYNPQLPGVFTGLGQTQLYASNIEAAQKTFLQQQEHTFDPQAAWHLAALTAPANLSAATKYLNSIPKNAPAAVLEQQDYLSSTLKIFNSDSPSAEIAGTTGIAMAQIGLWPLAIHALSLAAEHPDELTPETHAEILAFLGYALAQSGDPALEYFEQAQQVDPHSALPLYFKGLYLREKNALKAAEDSFKKAIDLDPQNSAMYVELGHTYLARGNLTNTELAYMAAIEFTEDKHPFQIILLNFYVDRGYLIREAGIPLAEEILAKDEDNAQVYDLLGWMQFLTGDADNGEEALRKSIELGPNLISAHYHLARFLETTEQHEAAKDAYQLVVDRDTAGGYRNLALKALLRLEAL